MGRDSGTKMQMYKVTYSRTPDWDFYCFNQSEIILSHIPIPAHGKDKKNEQQHAGRMLIRDVICNVKIMSPCRILVYSGFSGSLFHVFLI